MKAVPVGVWKDRTFCHLFLIYLYILVICMRAKQDYLQPLKIFQLLQPLLINIESMLNLKWFPVICLCHHCHFIPYKLYVLHLCLLSCIRCLAGCVWSTKSANKLRNACSFAQLMKLRPTAIMCIMTTSYSWRSNIDTLSFFCLSPCILINLGTPTGYREYSSLPVFFFFFSFFY